MVITALSRHVFSPVVFETGIVILPVFFSSLSSSLFSMSKHEQEKTLLREHLEEAHKLVGEKVEIKEEGF